MMLDVCTRCTDLKLRRYLPDAPGFLTSWLTLVAMAGVISGVDPR